MNAEDSCSSCGRENPPTRKKGKKSKKSSPVTWICCDSCVKWFHTICVKISDHLEPELKNYWFFCSNCCMKGNLIARTQPAPCQPASSTSTQEIEKKIEDLSVEIQKLRDDIEGSRSSWKKQLDRLRNRFHEAERTSDRQTERNQFLVGIEQKLATIESGAKLANSATSNINSFRIAINKVPYRHNENLGAIVQKVLDILGVPLRMSNVIKYFRLPVKDSKWSNRSITPTIIIVFDDSAARSAVLGEYYKKHREVKLSLLDDGLPLNYRFTLNEVLTLPAFRLRNLALRMKQRKLIKSVFIRNDTVSVRIANEPKYTLVNDIHHLLELTGAKDEPENTNDSSVFFDAVSSDFSASSTSA